MKRIQSFQNNSPQTPKLNYLSKQPQKLQDQGKGDYEFWAFFIQDFFHFQSTLRNQSEVFYKQAL